MAVGYSGVAQTVAENENIIFTASNPPCGVRYVDHENGTGIFGLKGLTNRRLTQYLVLFSANIAIPTGGTVGEISVALSLGGEVMQSSEAIVTPAAVEQFWGVTGFALISIPCGGDRTIAVRNTSDQPIDVENPNVVLIPIV